jgi:hypothetical protein
MPIKAATAIVLLSGALLAVLASPGATHLLPANAVPDTSPLPVLRTQGWLQDLFRGSGWEAPKSRMPEDDDRKPESM